MGICMVVPFLFCGAVIPAVGGEIRTGNFDSLVIFICFSSHFV